MKLFRRLILAAALFAGIAPAFAQVPGPVPALPDTERRTSYTISATTCACNVNFALYGDSTDFSNWVEVFLNGVRVNFNDATFGWTITSPSGPLASIARPVTDAILTFTTAQTGTVQIVGARRPRRTSQFNENSGVSARNLNQVLTDIIAQNRETWDKINDVTGRAVLAAPGETMALLTAAASRRNFGACFDSNGNLAPCASVPSTTILAGSGITFTGTNPTTISTNTYAAGTGITLTGSNPTTITSVIASANLPAPFTNGTIAGNTSKFATVTGSLTSNNCIQADASGNLMTSGAGCGGVVPYTDAKAAGLLNDGKTVSDGAMASGSTTLTSATAAFVSGDVGKLIYVRGAAASGNDLSTTIASFTNSTTVVLTSGNASGGAISSKVVTYGSNNSSTLNSLITSLGCQGTVWFYKGIYLFGSTISINNCFGGIKFIAAGPGGTAGASVSTELAYLGSTPFFNIENASGNIFDGFMFAPLVNTYSGATFKIFNGGLNSSDPSYNEFRHNVFLGAGSSHQHFNLDKSIETTIQNNQFAGGQFAIVGGNVSTGGYANNVRIVNNEFFRMVSAPLAGGGEGWVISGNTFEQLAGGTAGAFSSTETQQGMFWSGNWFGDVTANGGTWIDVAGTGFTFTGNKIASQSTTANVGIALEGVKGFSITGNNFQFFSVAISYATTPDGGIVCGNSYHNVTTFISGTGGSNIQSTTCNATY